MNSVTLLRFAALSLLLPMLSGCAALATAAARIALLVLLPMLFIGLFLLALWLQKRTPPSRDDADQRRYPDYRGDRGGD